MPYVLTLLLVFFAVSVGLAERRARCGRKSGDAIKHASVSVSTSNFARRRCSRTAARRCSRALDVIAREVGNIKGAKPSFRKRLDRILMQAAVSFSLRRSCAMLRRPRVRVRRRCRAVAASPVAGARWRPWLEQPSRPATFGLKWRARLEALRHQLPDAFDAMARSMRAGQTLEQALQSIALEFGPPLGAGILLLLRAAKPGPAARNRLPRPGPTAPA